MVDFSNSVLAAHISALELSSFRSWKTKMFAAEIIPCWLRRIAGFGQSNYKLAL